MRLILNADDLGLSEAVNAAVFEALDRGWLCRVSLLANGPAFEAAVSGLRARPGASVGVHLNLTEFTPLVLGERFAPWGPEIDPPPVSSVIAEWSAQVQRVLDAGLRPDHLDSHQHVHYRSELFPALVAVCERFGIRQVRGMAAHRLDVPAWRAWPQRLRAARFAAKLRRAGLTTTDGFGSATLFRALQERGLPVGESFEVMVHPGNPAHTLYAEEMTWVAACNSAGEQAFSSVTQVDSG